MLLHDLKRKAMLHPDDPEVRVELAEALLVEGDTEAATKQLEKALAIAPDHPRARRALARAHLQDGRPVPAERTLEEHVRRFPDDEGARDDIAKLLGQNGRVDDAIVHLEEALRVDPDNLERRIFVAALSTVRRLFGRAQRHVEYARRLPNGDPEMARRLHEIAMDLGDPAALAMPIEMGRDRLLGRTLEALASPLLRDAVRKGALKEVAAHLRCGDLGAAKRALVTAPPDEQATDAHAILRAEVALIEGDRDRAEKAFRRAAERSPGLAFAWSRLGELQSAKGQSQEAVACFETVLRLSPEDAGVMESLGDVLARMGRHDEALLHYERALDRRPEGMLAAKAAAVRSSKNRAHEDVPLVGSIAALAWNPFGGTVSMVEAVALPGKGELVFTGNVGKAIQDSAKVALSCLKARATPLGIEDAVSQKDLHLHFGEMESKTDGGSAGLALTLAGLSAFTGRPIRPRLGATGEITLQGAVKPVSGLHEKLVAAYLAGIEVVLAPRRNLLELKEVPAEVLRRVSLIYVNSLSEAIEHALLEGKANP